MGKVPASLGPLRHQSAVLWSSWSLLGELVVWVHGSLSFLATVPPNKRILVSEGHIIHAFALGASWSNAQ